MCLWEIDDSAPRGFYRSEWEKGEPEKSPKLPTKSLGFRLYAKSSPDFREVNFMPF